jgi:uncharacterized cupredoxin-like copper-binding protein
VKATRILAGLALCVGIAAGIAVAGCGSKKAKLPPANQAQGPAVAQVALTEREFALDPQNGQSNTSGVLQVLVRNVGTIDHALAIDTPHGVVQTDPIPAGSTGQIKVDLPPGNYKWYCPIDGHASKGMRGTLSVGSSSAVVPTPSTTVTQQTTTSSSSGPAGSGGSTATTTQSGF